MNIPKDPFKNLVLSPEEQKIEDNIESWKSIPNLEQEKKRYAQMAKNTLKKIKNKKRPVRTIDRLSPSDMNNIATP